MARLGIAADGSAWTVVRFPPGFTRPGAAYLDVEEGYLTLEGDLAYSGLETPTDTYTVIPAGTPRIHTHTRHATLAVARFDRPPSWLLDEPESPTAPIACYPLSGGSPVAGPAGRWHPIVRHGRVRVGRLAGGSSTVVQGAVILVDVGRRTIMELREGDEVPGDLGGPVVAWHLTDPADADPAGAPAAIRPTG